MTTKTESLHQRLQEMQARRCAPKQPNRINPAPRARYDRVYYDGIDWLDDMTGPEIPDGPPPNGYAHILCAEGECTDVRIGTAGGLRDDECIGAGPWRASPAAQEPQT